MKETTEVPSAWIKLDGIAVDPFVLMEQAMAVDRYRAVNAYACVDGIIEEVANQIVDGFTSDVSHGGDDIGGGTSTPLSAARRRVAKSAGDVAKREIERLEYALAHEKEQHNKVSNWAWAMYHAWPTNDLRYRPRMPNP